MEAHNTHNTHNTQKNEPEVSQAVDLARNYSKISVEDMCYFLNDRVDLARNESYFDGYDPDEFSGSEMYEFLKFKTDNFDIIKFQLVIDEIRLFTPLFYKIVDDDIINEESYNLEWNTDDKLHDYIERILELNDGLFLHCEQIKQFSLLAEKIYNELQKVDDQAINKLKKVDDQATTLKAVTKDKHIVRMKMIYTYLKDNKYIDCPENDFLYWFGLFEAKRPPKKMKWLKADSKLKNIIHHICGKSGEKYIRTAFIFNNGYITTNYKKDYVGSELFHEIQSYLFHAVTKI